MSNIFEIKRLKKYYETDSGLFKKRAVVKAIDDISFSVESGKILSVVGESGCGKSTLAKLLMGVESITSGEILFDGKRLSTFTKQDWKLYRRSVQIIFQDPYSSLNPRWNVGEIIAEPSRLNTNMRADEIKATLIDLAKKVGLKE